MKLGLFSALLVFTGSVWGAALPLASAKKALQAAEEFGVKKGWKLSIAIVNEEGNLVAFQRGDDAYSASIEAAIAKAKSANGFRRSTTAFVQGIKDGRNGLLSVPGVVAIEGGLPLTLDGHHVGAIGVSGARSTEDEEAANAGAKAVGSAK